MLYGQRHVTMSGYTYRHTNHDHVHSQLSLSGGSVSRRRRNYQDTTKGHGQALTSTFKQHHLASPHFLIELPSSSARELARRGPGLLGAPQSYE